LAKESNASYKQEAAEMRNTLSDYEAKIKACKTTISEMDEQFSLMTAKNKQLDRLSK
jgi:hypothetical protein